MRGLCRRGIVAGWLGLSAGALAGCMSLGPTSPMAAGTSAVTVDGAWSSQRFLAGEEQIHSALVDAMIDMKARPTTETPADRTTDVSILDAKMHDGRHARITMRPVESGQVVAVRIGRFGDPAYSQAFLQRVGVRLGTLPASAVPDVPPTSGSFGSRMFSRDAVPQRGHAPRPGQRRLSRLSRAGVRLMRKPVFHFLGPIAVALPTRQRPARSASEGISNPDAFACASGWSCREPDPVRNPSVNYSRAIFACVCRYPSPTRQRVIERRRPLAGASGWYIATFKRESL